SSARRMPAEPVPARHYGPDNSGIAVAVGRPSWRETPGPVQRDHQPAAEVVRPRTGRRCGAPTDGSGLKRYRGRGGNQEGPGAAGSHLRGLWTLALALTPSPPGRSRPLDARWGQLILSRLSGQNFPRVFRPEHPPNSRSAIAL